MSWHGMHVHKRSSQQWSHVLQQSLDLTGITLSGSIISYGSCRLVWWANTWLGGEAVKVNMMQNWRCQQTKQHSMTR